MLSDDHGAVLMEDGPNGWDLPCFVYKPRKPRLHEDSLIRRCCRDFAKWIHETTQIRQVHIAALVELLGHCIGADRNGKCKESYLNLVAVEENGYEKVGEISIPGRAEWKDHSFLFNLLETFDPFRSRNSIYKEERMASSISEPRHQFSSGSKEQVTTWPLSCA